MNGKREERELATLDENRRAVGILNPVRDKKGRHVPGGGEREDTCDRGRVTIKKGKIVVLFEVGSRWG